MFDSNSNYPPGLSDQMCEGSIVFHVFEKKNP